jgi:hypothetical protein
VGHPTHRRRSGQVACGLAACAESPVNDLGGGRGQPDRLPPWPPRLDGQPSGGLTRDHILDNITLYWLTSTATSSARLYWEFARGATAAFKHPPPHVSLPVAFTVFPGEIFQAPRHWVKRAYHNLIYFNEAAKGGHFAAWEEPQLFSEELRAAFRTLR